MVQLGSVWDNELTCCLYLLSQLKLIKRLKRLHSAALASWEFCSVRLVY